MTSITPLTLAAACAAIVCCARGLMIIRRVRWLPITMALGLITLIRIGIGIPLQDFFEGDVEFSKVAKERAAVVVLMFAFLLLIGQEVLWRLARSSQRDEAKGSYDGGTLLLIGLGFWTLAMLGHFYFLVIKQNLGILPTAIEGFTNPDDHYGYRKYFASIVYNAGRGQFASHLSIFVFTPLAFVLLAIAHAYTRRTLILCAMGVLAIVSPVAAVIHGQRSPLIVLAVVAGCSFVLALWGERMQRILRQRRLFKHSVLFGVIVVLFASAVYSYTVKVGMLEAIGMTLNRLIIVPAVTPNFIFELFPEQYDFRGVIGMFSMPDQHSEGNAVNYGDLAKSLTGVSFNVNSWAAAVGYSGLGYRGAFFISALIVALTVSLDRLLMNQPQVVRIASLVLSIDALQMLGNDGLLNALSGRGFIVFPLVLILAFRVAQRRTVSNREEGDFVAGGEPRFIS